MQDYPRDRPGVLGRVEERDRLRKRVGRVVGVCAVERLLTTAGFAAPPASQLRASPTSPAQHARIARFNQLGECMWTSAHSADAPRLVLWFPCGVLQAPRHLGAEPWPKPFDDGRSPPA